MDHMNDSVLVDLIKYAKHLEQRIKQTQNDIACLQYSDPTAEAEFIPEEESAGVNMQSTASCSTSLEDQDESSCPNFKLLELSVSRLTEHEFQLKVSCQKSSGVSLQLVRALEALNLDITNANMVSVGENVINADFVFKVADENCSTVAPGDLEDKIVKHVKMHGLHFL
ncbi:hypothetical protein GOP47_0029481 [Adiantum capillus-veneris]|nr:hypothetical protein GOP47_0029481 [Adiantum capillus-veneris]